jgi:hypothetical protein
MRIRALGAAALFLAFALASQAREDAKAGGLERFKQLAGEWTGKMVNDGKAAGDAKVTYKVTSGGSTVVETMDPGGDHEMVTVIHQDGKDLALTHYCMVGNQPHMKVDAKGDGNKFAFDFTGASNMKSDQEMHMHSVTYTFVDKDTLKAEWTHYMDGKKGGSVIFELKRKK